MTVFQKLLARFELRPEGLRYSELELIMKKLGVRKRKGKGSHVLYKFNRQSKPLTIPVHNGDCKPIYLKYAYQWLKSLGLM